MRSEQEKGIESQTQKKKGKEKIRQKTFTG